MLQPGERPGVGRRDRDARTSNILCNRGRMSRHTVRASSSVIGTAIPMQSKGSGSTCIRLDDIFGILWLIRGIFAPTEAWSAHPPSSFMTSRDRPTFLRNSLSSLRCSAVETPSADTKEEDNRLRSLMPRDSITLSVAGVGNRATVHLDNPS